MTKSKRLWDLERRVHALESPRRFTALKNASDGYRVWVVDQEDPRGGKFLWGSTLAELKEQLEVLYPRIIVECCEQV